MIKTKYRKIVTELPHKSDLEIINKISTLESIQSSKELPIVWDRANDFQIFDRWGNCWIDMTSSIFVTNAGHNSKKNNFRISKVIEKGLLHAYCYPTAERAAFLEKLIQFTPQYLEKASLASTGTEASERAIKLARLYNLDKSPDRNIIIGGTGNYHGKTLGALMSATDDKAKNWIGYHDPNMIQLPFPYPWILEKNNMSGKQLFDNHIKELNNKIDLDRICAMIIESYQGWGAVFYPLDYVKEMEIWCKQRDILLIADEIQSGFGRTGKLFGYQHYNIIPDMVICGKGISGGLPVSAVMGRKDLIELDSSLTSTHGGHPVSCAGALGNLEDFEALDLLNKAKNTGIYFKKQLENLKKKFPNKISRIEGNGMVWGIYFKKSKENNDLDIDFVDMMVDKLFLQGIFSIRTSRGVIKMGPPLTISTEALHEAIKVHEEIIEEMLLA